MSQALVHRCMREDMADHFRRISKSHTWLSRLKARDMARQEATNMPGMPIHKEKHGRPGRQDVRGVLAGRAQANVGYGRPRAYQFVDRRGERGNASSTPGHRSLRDMVDLQAVRRRSCEKAADRFPRSERQGHGRPAWSAVSHCEVFRRCRCSFHASTSDRSRRISPVEE